LLIRLSYGLGPVALTVALTAALGVAGCGASSSSGSGSSGSGSSGNTSQNSAFRQCLQQHGITLPQGRLGGSGGSGGSGGGTGTPRARPTGSAASAFRQAIQACGGGGFPGGGPGASSGAGSGAGLSGSSG
jgi:hypothetical protein